MTRFKRLILGLSVLGTPFFAGAQEPVLFSSLLGTVTVGDTQWQRLNLQPHIRSGAFEAVLDLEVFVDERGRFRNLGWDFSSKRKGLESIFRKIHYLRWGRPNDLDRPIYFRLGALESVTLGSGMIMRRYRNTQDAPGMKRTGLDFQIQGLAGGLFSFRGVVNDLLDLDGPVVGGRMVYRPTGKLVLGTTVVVDTDQLRALPDSIRTGFGRDAYGIAGVDMVYPLLNSVHLYGGVARTLTDSLSGTGFSGPGIRIRVGGLTVQVEYRWVDGLYQPGHFDALYELNRAGLNPATGGVRTREDALVDVSMQGVFGDLKCELGGFLDAGGSYQYLRGNEREEQLLEGRVALKPGVLEQLQKVYLAEAFFEKRHRGFRGFFDGSPDMRFGYRIGVEPMERLRVIWEVEFTYEPDAAGEFQRRRTFNLQSGITW